MYPTTMKCLMVLAMIGVVTNANAKSKGLQHKHYNISTMDDNDEKPVPPGLAFVGSGYNLVKGNPAGNDLNNGGVDPGLLPAMRILELTYKEGRLSDSLKYKLPDQIVYAPRESCKTETSSSIIISTGSYQKDLKASVHAEGKSIIIPFCNLLACLSPMHDNRY